MSADIDVSQAYDASPATRPDPIEPIAVVVEPDNAPAIDAGRLRMLAQRNFTKRLLLLQHANGQPLRTRPSNTR